MRKLFTFFVIAGMMSFVACGPSAKDKEAQEKKMKDSLAEVAKQDSIAKAEAAKMAEQAKQDSIAKADSLAKSEDKKAPKGKKAKK
ncbi:MAG: hypothetical protein Q8880_02475 [Bacteroidota bacterium]|nr:hypothetical protein [Bacteroidota bacterium]